MGTEMEAFFRDQCSLLERVASGAPLPDLLDSLVRLIEKYDGGMSSTILLLDETGTRVRNGAAPSLPAEYAAALDGQPIGPNAGSCGAAAFLKQPVVVEDIATHPNWVDYRDLALRHGLRACWSTPILSDDKVLGTFAMYYREPRGPSDHDRHLVEAATHLAAIAIAHDAAIRELREREQRAVAVANALRKSEERLRAVIEHTPNVAIQWYDDDGRLTFCNRASLDMFGWNASAVIGKTLHEIGYFSKSEEERFGTTRALAAKGTPPPPTEFTYKRADGSQGRVLSTVFQMPYGVDESCIVCMDVDLTELRRADDELRALGVQLQQNQRLQSLGTLASGIAHDFNNLLAAISSNASLALEPRLAPDEVRTCLGDIQAATARATKLVRQILLFARKQEARKELADVRPVIEEAIALVNHAVAARMKIVTRLPAEPVETMFDATQLHQVLVNLLTNASHAKADSVTVALAHYDHAGSMTLDLADGPYVHLSITDTGSGMDEATQARIFDPFFTTKPASEGTGLGLSIVHEIVRAHGGAITVRSRLGEGTTFDVYLPRVQEHAPARATNPTPGERILLLDDEDAMVFLGSRVLTKLGYQVSGFTNTTRALEEFRAAPASFTAVISDLSMPGTSGVAFLDEVRRIRPDVAVILTSGCARPEDIETSRAHGFGELVPKPHTVDEFAWAIAERLHERRSR